jgi:hypothetical protein
MFPARNKRCINQRNDKDVIKNLNRESVAHIEYRVDFAFTARRNHNPLLTDTTG